MLFKIDKLKMAEGRLAEGFCVCRESEVDNVNTLLDNMVETEDSFIIKKEKDSAEKILDDLIEMQSDLGGDNKLSFDMVTRINRVLGK